MNPMAANSVASPAYAATMSLPCATLTRVFISPA